MVDTNMIYDTDKFQRHMKMKALLWKPFAVNMGDDFAVFEFTHAFEMENALGNVNVWKGSYGYSVTVDGKDTFVIINTRG
jgi:hypothetical protein